MTICSWSPQSLKSVRAIHRYLGMFFTLMILFFAITGGLQMFGLHETTRGSSYLPPNILVHLSSPKGCSTQFGQV